MIRIILALITIWILAAIILPPIILPNFYFRKQRPNNAKTVKKISDELKSKSKKETLQNIFNFTTKNYIGKKQKYKVAYYPKLFKSNVEENLKHPNQFLACHLQNLILRDLLLNTKQFKPNNIKIKLGITKYLTMHQYLIIKISNQKFKVDPFYKKFEKL